MKAKHDSLVASIFPKLGAVSGDPVKDLWIVRAHRAQSQEPVRSESPPSHLPSEESGDRPLSWHVCPLFFFESKIDAQHPIEKLWRDLTL
jgi:hypothetical protein